MQRLTARLRRRLAGEHGASAVVLALLMVPLLGFGAIAVDLSSLYAQRARLQTAADAAALAVAQDCAHGTCTTPGATVTATGLIADNASAASLAGLSFAGHTVTVADSTVQDNWFARVLGIDSSTVATSATATWQGASAGAKALPIAFSYCEWLQQTGGGIPSGTVQRTIYLTKTSGTVGCTNPSHNVVPGGFGYLDTDPGACTATSTIGDQINTSSTGNNPPPNCLPSSFDASVGKTVLLPIFDDAGGTGNNAWYHVYGYAAFQLTGYFFGGQYTSSPAPCSGNERCIRGYFTTLVSMNEDFPSTPTAPLLGAAVVRLTR